MIEHENIVCKVCYENIPQHWADWSCVSKYLQQSFFIYQCLTSWTNHTWNSPCVSMSPRVGLTHLTVLQSWTSGRSARELCYVNHIMKFKFKESDINWYNTGVTKLAEPWFPIKQLLLESCFYAVSLVTFRCISVQFGAK